MQGKSATPDQVIAHIARRQHGVISTQQLTRIGLDDSAIARRVQAGRLHRIHRGVYAVGHPSLTREGRWMAAVLACKRAVLSHVSAAALWGIFPTCPPFVHVTVPGISGRKKRPGIVIHRSRTLGPAETTRRWGIPVTTHARTLRDLGYGPERTRSDLERDFLRLCRRHRIPKPEVNVRVGPYEVDFLWRAARLVIEADSWGYHSNRAAFESDRARDVELTRRGFTVLRFTYRQVITGPETVATSIRAELRRALAA
jgi:very-short-patch-repair endonuclease